MAFIFEKQPSEVRVIGIDFIDRLADEDTVASVEVSTDEDESSESDVLDGDPTFTDTQAIQQISGGVDGDEIKVTFLATTANGEILEEDVYVIVKEQ